MSASENTKEIKDKNERVYELGYLLVPTLSEEEVPAVYGNLKELISSLGGEHISDEMPKMTPLAYEMVKVVTNVRHKFSTAYFGWLKFAMGTEEIEELKKKLDFDPNVIRFLILKTVRESTIATKRFVPKEGARRLSKKSDEVAVPINEKEIDKEIDALIEA